MRPIGDLSVMLKSRNSQNFLERTVNQAAQSVTTGIVADKTEHLGGSTLGLSLLERKATLLKQLQANLSEALIYANGQQSSLEYIRNVSEDLANSLPPISQQNLQNELVPLSERAEADMKNVVQALNKAIAGKHVFSGTENNNKPLIESSTILSQVKIKTAGYNTASSVISEIDTWFESVGGGFDSIAYKGSSSSYINIPIGVDVEAEYGFRADDVVVRQLLKNICKVAIATDPSSSLSSAQRKLVLEDAYVGLIESGSPLITEQANLGIIEENIIESKDRISQEVSQTELMIQNMIGINQFEEVTKFEAAQKNLQILYQIVARQSQASFSDYLR
ncbi:hypothetical protein ACG74X_15350 [Marivita sp. S0852]|uniref:hypothetical protein n=1 Tax=Marivita sp. S0852 TaxID=3373893 RepID=UPI003982A7A8